MKARIIFWSNLALGAAILVFMLRTYGGPALDVLQSAPSVPLMATFLGVVATTIICLSYRWGFILRGLSKPPSLAILTLQRSAAHSLAVLVPSGQLGGDPLRTHPSSRRKLTHTPVRTGGLCSPDAAFLQADPRAGRSRAGEPGAPA